MGMEKRGRFNREGICVYLWLIHAEVWQKQQNSVKQLSFNKKIIYIFLMDMLDCLVAQRLKCLPAMQETRVRSLDQEDPLEKEMATCRGPAWGTPPMAKVMRNEAWHTQRHDQASGNPLFPSIYPKTRVCFMLAPTPLTLRGALPHNRFSRRRSKCVAPRQ